MSVYTKQKKNKQDANGAQNGGRVHVKAGKKMSSQFATSRLT